MAKQRMHDDQERDVALGWHIVHTYVKTRNDKRLPALKDLLRLVRPPQPVTYEQQLTLMQMISARYGAPIRRVRLIHKDAAHG